MIATCVRIPAACYMNPRRGNAVRPVGGGNPISLHTARPDSRLLTGHPDVKADHLPAPAPLAGYGSHPAGYSAGMTADCSLTFIGTATTLLRFGPFTLLTDPNFLHRGQHAYLGYGLATRRRTEPALTIDQLPELDAVVLSHMHGDHWDRVAKRGLRRDVPIVTTPKAARALQRQRFEAPIPLQTWESTDLVREGSRLTITSVPGRHATGVIGRLLPPVMGSVLTYTPAGAQPVRLYITGDTLFVDDLRAIPTRFPDIRTAVLHLGGTTLPGGLVVTMDARQGTDLLEFLRPQRAIPIHNDDYGVFKSPLSAFVNEATQRGLGDLVRVVAPGRTADLFD
jgi:L-ascorbate metabolism protein UlaG (beta-lactamase superfamily)